MTAESSGVNASLELAIKGDTSGLLDRIKTLLSASGGLRRLPAPDPTSAPMSSERVDNRLAYRPE